jgi:alpha-mannosidase
MPHWVVVPHTHWDREWYRTHEEFRTRLVRLVDGLLDLLDADPEYRHFTLDGQMIALDDYLEVRPEARGRVEALVRSGRLVIGPWYVLPDEWLVSGEALIRNLRLGLARAAEFGGGMRLGYVPDQFGHVGQLPQIFAGFGFEAAVLWRGVGEGVDETCFTWEAPDGTSLFSVYLVQGYGNATGLPLEPTLLASRLSASADALGRHSRIESLLFMNGSDHAEPQAGLPAALAAATATLDGVDFEIGTLPGFVERARKEAPERLQRHVGEFRSGLRAPLLEGCASTRLPQKRSDFLNDRLLTRYLEPLAAWLGGLGGAPDPGLIDLAWRVALENHPHDSICGCSIDRVHEQMEARFARVSDLAGAELVRTAEALGARIAVSEGAGRGSGVPLVVWNPNSGGVAQAEGACQLPLALGRSRTPALHLRDAAGRRIPVHAEVIDPGDVVLRQVISARVVAVLAGGFPDEFAGFCLRDIVMQRRAGRLEVEFQLGGQPRADFDSKASRETLAAALAEEGDREVAFQARRLPTAVLRFVDTLPGHGLRTYRLATGRAGGESPLSASATPEGGAILENEAWRLEVTPDGVFRTRHHASGSVTEDALRIVSEGDRGDEYSFDPVSDETPVSRPERVRVRVSRSEAEVALRIDARFRVPVGLAHSRKQRAARRATLSVRIEARLAAGLDRIDWCFDVENTARDHRLRAHLRAPFAARHFEVESAFEVAERPIAPAPDAFGSEFSAERPTGACPQRRFATLCSGSSAFTVANRGAAEVEAVVESDGSTSLAVTLLRAVGWLSRDDLAVRPSNAGPPLPTPGAQVPGPHRVEVSSRLHPAGDPTRSAMAHAYASPPIALAVGGRKGPLGDRARMIEVDDPAVEVSAIEPRPDGSTWVRLLNGSARARRVRLQWNGGGQRLVAIDLNGVRDSCVSIESDGAACSLELRPWQLVNLRAE